MLRQLVSLNINRKDFKICFQLYYLIAISARASNICMMLKRLLGLLTIFPRALSRMDGSVLH